MSISMRPCNTILVTGGSGFIGSACIHFLLRLSTSLPPLRVINLDLLTYAANPNHPDDPRYRFVHGDINDRALVKTICREEQIDTILHFAAETHVDRSIENADPFLEANVKGTLSLLEVVRTLPHIHLHHVSTDEVYGSLGPTGHFSETSPYRPNSPYAASKAASDHFVRAYTTTYRLSTTISHCSNNYGPGQHPEKLIPRLISCALAGEPLPIYGTGNNIRDWLFVDDHIDAIWRIARTGRSGETYDIGADTERTNLEIATEIAQLLSLKPQIQFVPDRPGHDYRYAIDSSKIRRELHWRPTTSLTKGLRITLDALINKNLITANSL